MEHRALGKTELRVPVVVFGAWAIGGWNWGGSDDDAAVRAIQCALGVGIDAVDTAPVYGFGRSEEVVGRALVGRRDEVRILTKVGLRWDAREGVKSFETAGPGGAKLEVYRNSRPESVRHEVEQSLRRLRTDRIDLVQVHWHDPTTEVRATMEALLALRREGKVREIGVSNFPVAQLEEARVALAPVPLASDQPKYSLVARDAERDVLPWCLENSVGTLVYSPLEQGLLTGKVTAERAFPDGDGRQKRATFTPENRRRVNAELERVVAPIARAHGATLAQVVIAWTVAQRGVTSAIVGARTEAQVRENARGGELVLAADELARIRAAFEGLALAGHARAGGWRALARRLLGR